MVLDEDNLKLLSEMKRKRGVIKASLTRIKTFVSKFDPREQALSLLEFRQEELPQINRKFDTIQSEIELIDIHDQGQAEEERETFEHEYFSIRSKIQELINSEKSHNISAHNSSFLTGHHIHRTQLPPIKMPEFSGNIQDWESFFDCFRSMVHEDISFTPAQKFYYLKSCVTGAAGDLIKAVPMTDANYDVAIARLKQRYDNRSLTIQSHIRSLLESPYVEKATAIELQQLHAHVCTHVAALKALDQPVDKWDAWLITIISMRLDQDTSHGWQLHQKNTQLPRYIDFEEFLASRCIAIENSSQYLSKPKEPSYNPTIHNKSKGYNTSSNAKKFSLLSEINDPEKCVHYSGQHRLFSCESFKELNVNRRLAVVREARLCFNCLAPYHSKDYCKSRFTCQICKGRHNTLLHQERKAGATTQNEEGVSTETQENVSPANSQRVSIPAQTSNEYVLLATAIVMVRDNNGSNYKCRAVLDSGSQVNFISKKLANILKLNQITNILPICGIGSSKTQSGASVQIHVSSSIKKFEIDITCHLLPVIVSNLATIPTPRNGWKIPDELAPHLADPTFCESGSIDLLIGSAVFFDLIETERIPLATGNLCLQDSKFGWIVTGGMDVTCLINVSKIPKDDWEPVNSTDESTPNNCSKGNQRCLEDERALCHFQQHTRRNEDGRFIVRLPINTSTNMLGNTLSMATTRFLSVERRLQRDDALRLEYTKFMNEYQNLGHMQEIKNEVNPPTQSFYLPHHAVQKESSLTTKIRVVFDASARSSSGISLNDILMYGPTVQSDVFTILARFRMHQYVEP